MEELQAAECIVCGKVKLTGIRICGQLICEECERAIVSTDAADPEYGEYVECMKRIWFAALS